MNLPEEPLTFTGASWGAPCTRVAPGAPHTRAAYRGCLGTPLNTARLWGLLRKPLAQGLPGEPFT